MNLLAARKHQFTAGELALFLLPIASLGMGTIVNTLFLPVDYEWWGLLRIFGDLSKKDGFWLIASVLWGIGLASSRGLVVHHMLAKNGGHSALFIVVSFTATFGFLVATGLSGYAGTLADLLAMAAVISGIFIAEAHRAKTWKIGIKSGASIVIVGVLVLAGYTAISYWHTMMKGVLFQISSPADEFLWQVDQSLFGEAYYVDLQSWRVNNQFIVEWLDFIYIGLLQQICWALFYFHSANDRFNAKRYLLSMFLIYSLGSLTYFALPSSGPLFYQPGLFGDLRTRAPDTWNLAHYLALNTEAVAHGAVGEVAPYGYIAAFPSLHVGVAAIMICAMKGNKAMLVFTLILFALTCIATNILGWHYTSDILAGFFLGIAAWKASCSLFNCAPDREKAESTPP